MKLQELEDKFGLHTVVLQRHQPTISDPAGVMAASVGVRDQAGNGLYFTLDHLNRIREVAAHIGSERKVLLFPVETTFTPGGE